MSEFDPSTAKPWRRRTQSVLEWFGLVDDGSEDPNAEPKPRSDWERIFFAFAIPLWASDRVHGWWYAVYVALGAVNGLVELVRWRRRSFERGRLDSYASLLQMLPLFALVILLFFGEDTGAGLALVYAVAFSAAAVALVLALGWLLRRRESHAADSV